MAKERTIEELLQQHRGPPTTAKVMAITLLSLLWLGVATLLVLLLGAFVASVRWLFSVLS
jgi:hypothetical protein